jgi:hypothetical protein
VHGKIQSREGDLQPLSTVGSTDPGPPLCGIFLAFCAAGAFRPQVGLRVHLWPRCISQEPSVYVQMQPLAPPQQGNGEQASSANFLESSTEGAA